MQLHNSDLGASLYKSWTDDEKRAEIGRLTDGYRNGLPTGIYCKMVETIAGSRKKARSFLREFLTSAERTEAINKETGGVQIAVKELMK
jgi:hypothetical protein